MFKDCQGVPYPVFAKGLVTESAFVVGAIPFGSVSLLKVRLEPGSQEPAAGQFYMLHAVRSDVLLGRPISVYHSEKRIDGSVELSFLILLKGKGTRELFSLELGDKLNLIGPCGNRFPAPGGFDTPASQVLNHRRVLIVGGGIGVAPVAGFAETLPEKSYDFYASFKSGSYGLENLKADKLVITTDDGSVGVHGMLPAALTEEALKAGNYAAVYACGPTPMLAYVQKICKEAGIKCWLSMEAHMACGVGVCLGCVIDTTEGKKRCCKEGPVFDGDILIFKPVTEVAGIKVQPRREPLSASE